MVAKVLEEKVGLVYGNTLVELGRDDDRIVVVEADLMKASGSQPFQAAFPERHFQVGVAEQNLVGVAAGMAAMGKIPFASSFANFISQRSCDQAVYAIAYNNFNVKLCGTYAGLTSEKNGGTHISVEDVAIFRCMPNMVVIDPADCFELAQAMRSAAYYQGPVYLRMARGPLHRIFTDSYSYEIGRAVRLRDGDQASLITSGITTWEGILACEQLAVERIQVRHIHMPTIKPIDRDEIVRAARETGAIVTVENHSRLGGLGGAVTEAVCEEYPVPVLRLGMNDLFGQTAKLSWLLNEYGISNKHIAEAVKDVIKRKRGGRR